MRWHLRAPRIGKVDRYTTLVLGCALLKRFRAANGAQAFQPVRQAGIKIAIASASKNCRTVLESLQITDMLDGIADGYSVVNGKPAPDLFVYAAGMVRVPTPACLGVEDADAGIEAIKAAGMQALGIGPKERFHKADKVMPTLANAHLRDILS